jgi:hypothetical protein
MNTKQQPQKESLSGIVQDLKDGKISVHDAQSKLQVRQRERPYAKVTKRGAVALYGIGKDPIIMYASQWNRLQKTIRSGYLDKYMEANKDRISYIHPNHQESVNNLDSTSDVVTSILNVEVIDTKN